MHNNKQNKGLVEMNQSFGKPYKPNDTTQGVSEVQIKTKNGTSIQPINSGNYQS